MHTDHVELLDAARRAQGHRIAFARLEQRARHRRYPADVAALRVDLVDADDADRPLVAFCIGDRHRRTEEHGGFGIVVARRGRIDDLGVIEAPHEKADAPVDLAQPLLAVDVIAVLGAVAVARGPRDGRDELRPFLRDEAVSSRRKRAKPPGVM